MNCEDVVQALVEDSRRSFQCQTAGRQGAWLVTTTALYSDRDVVQVVVEAEDDGHARVSDGGLTILRLDMSGAPWQGGPRRKKMVSIARAYGLDLDEAAISTRVKAEAIPAAIHRVASAAVQLDTFIHDDLQRRSRSFADEVSKWLRDHSSRPFEPNAMLPGTRYRCTARVETQLPVFLNAVGGTDTTDRRKSLVAAGWDFERAPSLRPEQRVVILRSKFEDYPRPDVDRILEFGTVATWESRLLLVEHLRGADQPNWSAHERLLVGSPYLS